MGCRHAQGTAAAAGGGWGADAQAAHARRCGLHRGPRRRRVGRIHVGLCTHTKLANYPVFLWPHGSHLMM